MPEIAEILTRLTPGKYDAQRAANFDASRVGGFVKSSFPVERILNFDAENRTADFAFASDAPIEHWFGYVILDTDKKSVDLSRVENGVAPYLVNHRTDQHVGVVIPGTVELGPVIRGTVKFSRSTLGEEILNDVRDEVRNGVSLGFLIDDMILESDKEGEIPVYRAKKWTFLEASSASIPADYENVGAGRSFEREQIAPPISEPPSPVTRAIPSTATENTMTDAEKAAAEAEAARTAAAAPAVVETRSADEIAADEVTAWGKRLNCPELATRFLAESFGDEKDVTVRAFKQFIKANEGASTHIPAGSPAERGFSPGRVNERMDVVSIGEAFIRSELYKGTIGKSRQRGTSMSVDVPIMPSMLRRDTFTSSGTGSQTYINYEAGPIMVEQQRLTVRDLLMVGQTNLSSVPYMKETSFTNAATTVAEEGEKPEATFALQDEFAPVKKIAVIGRVTDEVWNDFPMVRDYINGRLRFMVQQREEAQLLSGAGTGSEIEGLLTVSGTQSQALGGDTRADAVYKAITKVRSVGFFEPDAAVFHPDDWQQMRLEKDTANQYYGGGPFSGAYGNGPYSNADRYWGLPVVVTTAITSGTGLVGAFKLGAQIWDREGITVDATNSDQDDFTFNRMAIRVEERLALAIYRPLAFCKVTGI